MTWLATNKVSQDHGAETWSRLAAGDSESCLRRVLGRSPCLSFQQELGPQALLIGAGPLDPTALGFPLPPGGFPAAPPAPPPPPGMPLAPGAPLLPPGFQIPLPQMQLPGAVSTQKVEWSQVSIPTAPAWACRHRGCRSPASAACPWGRRYRSCRWGRQEPWTPRRWRR